jgi:hypothetical protein
MLPKVSGTFRSRRSALRNSRVWRRTCRLKRCKKPGLIEYKRGEIRILDVSRMREAVCECYQAVNDQYAEIAAPSDH